MSTLKTKEELDSLKNKGREEEYEWPVKNDLKNAVYAYKAFINGGTTEHVFNKAVNNLLYNHFKKNHVLLSKEEVLITDQELAYLNMTCQEFSICMQTISNTLLGIVGIHSERAHDADPQSYAFKITLTLIK
ncbi:MAG: hypothetical protein V4478_03070 [Patescibacteria group bacterium]